MLRAGTQDQKNHDSAKLSLVCDELQMGHRKSFNGVIKVEPDALIKVFLNWFQNKNIFIGAMSPVISVCLGKSLLL